MTSHNTTAASGADSRAEIVFRAVFEHPDGGQVWFSSTGLFGVTEPCNGSDTEDCAAIPMGSNDLRRMAYRLMAVAAELEGHTMIIHDSRNTESVTVLAEYMNESELVHEADALWIQNSLEGQWACLPIEDADLIELGKRLQKLGRKLTKNTTTK